LSVGDILVVVLGLVEVGPPYARFSLLTRAAKSSFRIDHQSRNLTRIFRRIRLPFARALHRRTPRSPLEKRKTSVQQPESRIDVTPPRHPPARSRPSRCPSPSASRTRSTSVSSARGSRR